MGRPPRRIVEASAKAPAKTRQDRSVLRGTSRAATPAKDLPWLEAIQKILAEAETPLTCAEIAERIIDKGLRRSVGATPAQTVAANLSLSLRDEGSPFFKVARGVYTVKKRAQEPQGALSEAQANDETAQTGALRAFGMFWRRDRVVWSGTPSLMGKQQSGASDVNFAGQVGVYLLHDRDRVIYVGRATENTLYTRLKTHTLDRLSGRWDRFSWFGLKGVNADATLSQESVPWTEEVVVETMEALLIESLEPPLNRRRGDNFAAVEYIQVADPQITKREKLALLDEMRKSMGVD